MALETLPEDVILRECQEILHDIKVLGANPWRRSLDNALAQAIQRDESRFGRCALAVIQCLRDDTDRRFDKYRPVDELSTEYWDESCYLLFEIDTHEYARALAGTGHLGYAAEKTSFRWRFEDSLEWLPIRRTT